MLFLTAWVSGCASARAVRLAHVQTVAGPSGKALLTPESERRHYFDLARLRWDGTWVSAGDDRLSLGAAKDYMRHSGANDLADALDQAQPAYVSWPAEHGWKKGEGLSSHDGGAFSGLGGFGSGEDDAKALAVITAASVAGIAAYVATDSLLRGIGSDLNPKPCLEDVLEAYNQRLAVALGLNPADPHLVTSMPRWSGISGRDHGRASRLVRVGIAGGLVVMTVASLAAWIAPANNQPTPQWAWPAFYTGAGTLAASLLFGTTLAW